MANQYIVVEEQSYGIEGSDALQIATNALESAQQESARIYNGDPDDPDGYASEYYLHMDGTRRMSRGT